MSLTEYFYVFLSSPHWCYLFIFFLFPISIKEAVTLINTIDLNKLSRLISRILQKLHLKVQKLHRCICAKDKMLLRLLQQCWSDRKLNLMRASVRHGFMKQTAVESWASSLNWLLVNFSLGCITWSEHHSTCEHLRTMKIRKAECFIFIWCYFQVRKEWTQHSGKDLKLYNIFDL